MPRQSRCSNRDAEFNIRAEGEDGKTAFEYKQFDCLRTYDTLSETGKRKREFVCRGVEVKLRLIVLRTCLCELLSCLYRNKLDVAERGGKEGKGVQGSKAPVGGLGREPPPPVQGRSLFRGVSLPVVVVQ